MCMPTIMALLFHQSLCQQNSSSNQWLNELLGTAGYVLIAVHVIAALFHRCLDGYELF